MRGAAKAAVVLVGAGSVCAVAACGGGSPLSKSEFDAKANAICAEYTRKLNAVPAPATITQVPAYVVVVKPYIERGVDALASLSPPAALEATYDSWMTTRRESLKQTDELQRAAERNDLVGVNRMIHALKEGNGRGNALASKLGAGVCARG